MNARSPLRGFRFLRQAAVLPLIALLQHGGTVGQEVSPAPGTQTGTGSGASAPALSSQTVLPDGTVLLLGGRDESGRPIQRAERLTPTVGRKEVLPLEWRARFGHTATLLNAHQVLIAGGVNDAGMASQLEVLDLHNMQVTQLGDLDVRRAYHQATLLADGRVALWGGKNGDDSLADSGVIVDPDARTVIDIFVPERDPSTLYVAASDPSDGSTGIPLDQPLMVRLSRPVTIDARSGEGATLTGPSGDVEVNTIAAEGGRLVFVTPTAPLEPDTQYLLTLTGLRDAQGSQLAPPFNIGFTTGPKEDSTRRGEPDSETWDPFERGQFQEWRTNRPESPWQRLPPLKAATGVTALAGQVLRLNGAPLSRVTLEIEGHTATTDQTGRFLLPLGETSTGWQELWIDGRSATRPGTTYGTFEAAVRITAGETSVLPFTIWMPKIDTHHQVTIPSATDREVIVTTPTIPGLELHLPPRTVIRDHEGAVVQRISITPIPLDRTPFPLPAGVDVPIYFTIQPGGAYVHVYGTRNSGYASGARLIYPNHKGRPPNSPMDFWHYDPEEGKGWYVYGQGAVSSDGRHLVPGPGVSIHEFTGAMVAPPGLAPPLWPLFGNPFDGEPVDLGTGLFIMEKSDLVVPDVLPLELRRTYRQNDTVVRSFGIGATHLYDIFLVGNTSPYTYIDLILPDGARVHFDRISAGTGYADAVYEHASSPTSFFKSRITWNGNGWDLTMKDGSRITFREGFLASRPAQAAATRIQDRYGNAIALTRNLDADLTRITAPNGRWIELTYDASHRVTQARDNINRLVQYTYDVSGRLWKVTDAAGGLTEYSYDAGHRMLTIKDARGIVYLTNEYDTAGRVIKQTQADNSMYQFAYTLDGSGKITQTDVTNPRGYVRRVTFGSTGYVSTDTEAFGRPEQRTTAYEWASGTNLLLAIVDALNRRTTLTYDSFGNVTSTTRLAATPDAVTKTFTYEPTFQQLASLTDPLNHTMIFGHDAQGNLTSIKDPLNHETLMTYNPGGQLTSITDPLNQTTTFGYDGGDLVSTTDPLSRMTTRYLDDAGRVLGMTNALGQSIRYEHDALDRLTQTIDALGSATTFAYDPNGNLLALTDGRNKATTWTYDAMDRVQARTDPLNRQESFAYDLRGNLTAWTDRKGKVTTYQYDALDRQTFVGFGTTGNPPGYTSTITRTYDAGDRLTQVVDSAAGTIVRSYDLLDRLTQEATPQGNVSYTFDTGDRRTTMTVAGQTSVSYSYDNANRLTGAAQGPASATITYDNADRRTSLTLANGVMLEYTYNADSTIAGLTYKLGGSTLGTLAYNYDATGRRTSIGGTYARTGLPAALTTATYDGANQIVTLGGASFTYDANGNLTSDGVRAYAWDERNQLVSVAGPVSASFGYDAFGRRRTKTVGSVTTGFLYDRFNLVQELVSASPVANMLSGLAIDELFLRTDAAGVWNYLTDAVGSTLALTDSAGAIQSAYTYEPFGSTTVSGSANSNTLQYAGRENDGTGLYYYRARYYDTRIGKFLSEDPIGFESGVNVYTYVLNDPINLIDPFGLDITICFYPEAAAGLGHVGFGLPGESGTEGFYPKKSRWSSPGEVKADVLPTKGCKTIKSPPEKDDCMRRCRAERKANPGNWTLDGRNCTDFVRRCLDRCGLLPAGASPAVAPGPFYNSLPPAKPKRDIDPTVIK